LAYIPDDKDEQGLFPLMSTAANITIRNLDRISRLGFIPPALERLKGRDYADMLGIKAENIDNPVMHLSNGNKQKALVARSIFSSCSVYVFDEATKGVDSAGKVEIYNIINELLRKGAGVLLVSSDFEELIGMCDRLLIIQKGRLIAELAHGDVDQHKLLALLEG
jgi:ribose transport system ATP-binding protein